MQKGRPKERWKSEKDQEEKAELEFVFEER